MARLTDSEIDEIARRIAADIARGGTMPAPLAQAPSTAPAPAAPPQVNNSLGIYSTIPEAVAAAAAAQPKLVALGLAARGRIIAAMRQAARENCELLAKAAHDETGHGRYEDKIVKNRLVTEKTAGIEDLAPLATSGDHGLTLTEPA